jgi:xanthine dehydrogenase accessory factor
VLATILDGDDMGEKALWIDGILRWESTRSSVIRKYEKDILTKYKSGIVNTSSQRIFCERIGNRKKLVVCGAGHVSIPIIELAKLTGFDVTVIDDRPSFADNARRAGADRVICDDFVKALDAVQGGSDTYFVVVTRGHRYDMDCLRSIHSKKSAYVGMMGSRRRVAMMKKELLENVHAPIGLPIGSETPEEIAVSIMAEIIQVKNSRGWLCTYDDELLSYLVCEKASDGCGILCTIVEKKGSAPRECGTKLLILPDNKVIGTIGGGCAESSIIETGRFMLSEKENNMPKIKPRLELVDMTADEDKDEGMVCGGTILVYMECVPVYMGDK